MAPPSDIKRWVSDKVMKLTGISEPSIIDFIIENCNSSKSAETFVKNTLCRDAQFPKNDSVQEFGKYSFGNL